MKAFSNAVEKYQALKNEKLRAERKRGAKHGAKRKRSNTKGAKYKMGQNDNVYIRESHPFMATEPGLYCECGWPRTEGDGRCGRCGSEEPGEYNAGN